MVGAVRFELTTSCTRNKRASHATLRPEPNRGQKMRNVARDCNGFLRFVGGSSKGGMATTQNGRMAGRMKPMVRLRMARMGLKDG